MKVSLSGPISLILVGVVLTVLSAAYDTADAWAKTLGIASGVLLSVSAVPQLMRTIRHRKQHR